MKNALAVAALGLAAFFGIAACGTSVAATSAPRPSAAPADNTSVAREIANVVAGKGGLPALANGTSQAAAAYCDPGTVSHAPNATTTSASCGIDYSDGSVWKQTVTVTFDSHGNPIADLASLGTEVLQPTDGQL